MPLRPFGLPTFSVRSRVTIEVVIMDLAKDISGATPGVLDRVRDTFIDRLYGLGATDGRQRPLLRLSIVEIDTLCTIALDVCSKHPDDPDAAQQDALARLRRNRPGTTIFSLVEGDPIETVGLEIITYGRTVLTDPEACIPAAVSVTLYDQQGLVMDSEDRDDIIDGGLEIQSFI